MDLKLYTTDLPLLVFGGTCPHTGVLLGDAFTSAFSIEMNLSCWKKCGAVPLTRAPVHDSGVRSQVAVGAAAARDDMSFQDPMVETLKKLEAVNHFYTDFLNANGFDGCSLDSKPRQACSSRATG